MRRLVLCVIVLLAIVTVVRAYTLAAPGVTLSPGLLELTDGSSSVTLAFGLAASDAERAGRRWGLLPMRLEYRAGDSAVSLSLGGLAFLLAGRATLGQPVAVDRPVTGNVISAGGPVDVRSRVDGDVWALGSNVTLGPTAQVTGAVVAIGGTVRADPRSRAAGGIHELPALRVPMLGILGTGFSGVALALARGVGLFVLEVILLGLLALYLPRWLGEMAGSATRRWRPALLTVVVALVALPALVLLLVASGAGIFILPFLALGVGVLAGAGALAVCARFGSWMRSGDIATAAPLYLFTSGLLGLFVIRAPGLAGALLGAVSGAVAATASEVLRLASLAAGAVLLAWGFGSALAAARART